MARLCFLPACARISRLAFDDQLSVRYENLAAEF